MESNVLFRASVVVISCLGIGIILGIASNRVSDPWLFRGVIMVIGLVIGLAAVIVSGCRVDHPHTYLVAGLAWCLLVCIIASSTSALFASVKYFLN